MMHTNGPKYVRQPWNQEINSRMECDLYNATEDVGGRYALTRAELAEQLRLLADWIDQERAEQRWTLPTEIQQEGA